MSKSIWKLHERASRTIATMELVITIFIIIICGAVTIGYVKNIIKLTRCDFEAPYKAEVIHLAGLIPPVGAVVGYMDFGK